MDNMEQVQNPQTQTVSGGISWDNVKDTALGGAIIGAILGVSTAVSSPDVGLLSMEALQGGALGAAMLAPVGGVVGGAKDLALWSKTVCKQAIHNLKNYVSEAQHKRLIANEDKAWAKLDKAIKSREKFEQDKEVR